MKGIPVIESPTRPPIPPPPPPPPFKEWTTATPSVTKTDTLLQKDDCN